MKAARLFVQSLHALVDRASQVEVIVLDEGFKAHLFVGLTATTIGKVLPLHPICVTTFDCLASFLFYDLPSHFVYHVTRLTSQNGVYESFCCLDC